MDEGAEYIPEEVNPSVDEAATVGLITENRNYKEGKNAYLGRKFSGESEVLQEYHIKVGSSPYSFGTVDEEAAGVVSRFGISGTSERGGAWGTGVAGGSGTVWNGFVAFKLIKDSNCYFKLDLPEEARHFAASENPQGELTPEITP